MNTDSVDKNSMYSYSVLRLKLEFFIGIIIILYQQKVNEPKVLFLLCCYWFCVCLPRYLCLPSLFTSQMTTLQFNFPKFRAKWAPTPPPPPVINTTWPDTSYEKWKKIGNISSMLIVLKFLFFISPSLFEF